MNLITFLNSIATILYLILGIYFLKVNIKNKINIRFSITVFCLAVISITHVLSDMAGNIEVSIIYIKIYVSIMMLFLGFILHFFIELTQIIKNKKIINIIIFIPVLILIINFILSKKVPHIDKIIREDNTLFFVYNGSIWSYLYFGSIFLYVSICVVLVFLWGKRSKLKKVKSQSMIISITLLLSLILPLLECLIIPNVTSHKSSGINPVFVLIWMLGIFYSINRYRFLSLTPELISNYLISNINELIILLDSNLKITHANKKTEELMNEDKNKIINKDFKDIVLKYDLVKNEIDKMMKNQYKDFSCRIYFKGNTEPVLMDAKFSKVFDKFDDLIGILVIANEVKELKQLKLFYKLSDRETEIIQSMVDGHSNKEIGDELNLVESTVKSHVTHIFNKLGIDNRVELMNLLYEFNVIPSHSAEKKVLILK